jgi:short-subunit dehydrogenase
MNQFTKAENFLDGRGQFAVVTGASSGLGKIFAQRLAGRGYNIIAVARRAAELEALAAELRTGFGVVVDVISADLRSRGDCERLAKQFERDDVTLLLNNAGYGKVSSLAQTDKLDVAGQIELNVLALSLLTQAASANFVRRASGGILNVASLAGFMPVPGFSVYAATKAYVLSLSLALADELAGSGVRVSVACPGYTDTGFFDVSGLSSKIRGNAMSPDQVVDYVLKRFGAGEVMIVPGFSNQLLTQIAAHLPHQLAARAAGLIFRRQMTQK